jgi:hypothetical protein
MPPINTTTPKSDSSDRYKKLQVMLPQHVHEQVIQMAQEEDRSASSMGARLIQEAIESREH